MEGLPQEAGGSPSLGVSRQRLDGLLPGMLYTHPPALTAYHLGLHRTTRKPSPRSTAAREMLVVLNCLAWLLHAEAAGAAAIRLDGDGEGGPWLLAFWILQAICNNHLGNSPAGAQMLLPNCFFLTCKRSAHIFLSTLIPDAPCSASPANGMGSFQSWGHWPECLIRSHWTGARGWHQQGPSF